jgi:hypothetical protein
VAGILGALEFRAQCAAMLAPRRQPMPTPLDTLDPFNMKVQLSRLNDVGALGRRMVSDLDAVRTARRALLPLPVVDRPRKA